MSPLLLAALVLGLQSETACLEASRDAAELGACLEGRGLGYDEAAGEQGRVDSVRALTDAVARAGGFGATTLERALDEAELCETPVSYAARVAGDTWIAVCAGEDGVPMSYRGAL